MPYSRRQRVVLPVAVLVAAVGTFLVAVNFVAGRQLRPAPVSPVVAAAAGAGDKEADELLKQAQALREEVSAATGQTAEQQRASIPKEVPKPVFVPPEAKPVPVPAPAPSRLEAAEKMEVEFEPGKLGMVVTYADGLVTGVEDFEQADKEGVLVNMTIVAIQGEPYTEERLMAAFASNDNYRVTFAKAVDEGWTVDADEFVDAWDPSLIAVVFFIFVFIFIQQCVGINPNYGDVKL